MEHHEERKLAIEFFNCRWANFSQVDHSLLRTLTHQSGFPKTGTSTLMFYLRNHSESIFIFPDERCELAWNQHVPLLKDLYKEYQPKLLMGIKCPSNLEVDLALKNYNKFFPATKFIVGVRHPVHWFESFYNFRITNVSSKLGKKWRGFLVFSLSLFLTTCPVLFYGHFKK